MLLAIALTLLVTLAIASFDVLDFKKMATVKPDPGIPGQYAHLWR